MDTEKVSFTSLSSRAKIGEKAVQTLRAGGVIPDYLALEIIKEALERGLYD